jgi:hypothetical protein
MVCVFHLELKCDSLYAMDCMERYTCFRIILEGIVFNNNSLFYINLSAFIGRLPIIMEGVRS